MEGSVLTHKVGDDKYITETPMPDHTAAINAVFAALTAEKGGVLKSMSDIDAVGHRVLHGADKFSESVIVTKDVEDVIEECIPLGPLHNPANLAGIRACKAIMPGVPQVAVFDTAFHQTMPAHAYTYALPYEYYERYKLRRYGFHGSSHRYVSHRAAQILGRENDPDFKLITCHLGNGSSFAAIKGGKCIDTSMGLTPLEGIEMGTRSGSIDPAILEFIMSREKIDIGEMTSILNKKSGVLGVSGVSSDFRDLDQAAEQGNARARLALDIFDYEGSKLIAGYAAALGGVDAIVFTAGIGENSPPIREHMTKGLDFMGIAVDPAKNNIRGKEADISKDGSKVKVLVIPTDEELVLASDTKRLAKGK
jgi:acetate kinase